MPKPNPSALTQPAIRHGLLATCILLLGTLLSGCVAVGGSRGGFFIVPGGIGLVVIILVVLLLLRRR